MKVKELIDLLQEFPPECDVFMEIKGQTHEPFDVELENAGTRTWVLITDYEETG